MNKPPILQFKHAFLCVAICFPFLLLNSCYRNTTTVHIENQDMIIKSIMKNGELNGPYKIFTKDKNLVYEAFFKNGSKHGTENSYFMNGNIKTKKEYSNGMLNGSYNRYYENGKIEFEGIVENDTIVFSKTYDQHGCIIDMERKIDLSTNNEKSQYSPGNQFKSTTQIYGDIENSGEVIINWIINTPDSIKEQFVVDIDAFGMATFEYFLKDTGCYRFKFYCFIENDLDQLYEKEIEIQVKE